MKGAIYWFIVLVATTTISCDKQRESLHEDTLGVGQCKTYKVAPANITICFEAVEQESRCPVGVTCVWEGIAVTRFRAGIGADNHIITLATRDFHTYSKDTLVDGVTIELVNLTPYPDATATTTSNSYRATLRVTR